MKLLPEERAQVRMPTLVDIQKEKGMATKYHLPKIEELLTAGVHFGHQLKRWHPKMEPYIYTSKKNMHILDLEKTMEGLKTACEFIYETASKGGQIIFVGTKKQAAEIVEIEAKRSGALFVTDRWLGGTLTNYKVIKKNGIDKLLNFIKRKETGDLDKYTKKERLMIDREIEKLQKSVGGISALKGVPAALFIIDVKREKTAIREALRCHVPIIALVDTNSDPTSINHVIPGNDDAIKSIAIVVAAISDACEKGYIEFAAAGDKAAKLAQAALAATAAVDDSEKEVEKIILEQELGDFKADVVGVLTQPVVAVVEKEHEGGKQKETKKVTKAKAAKAPAAKSK